MSDREILYRLVDDVGQLKGTVGGLAALNGTDVAFIDSSNDELRTYRFGFYLGTGPHNPNNPNWT